MNPKEALAPPDFNGMSLRELLNMRLTIREIIDFKLVFRFTRHRDGSRYFWGIVKSMHSDQQKQAVDNVVMELMAAGVDWVAMTESAQDHQTVSQCFGYGSRRQQQILLDHFVNDSVLRLSCSQYGSHFVQGILPLLNDEERQRLVECLMSQCIEHQDMQSLCRDVNASHVFQVVLKLKLPFEWAEFIGKAIEEDLVGLSGHVNGCRVVQAFIQKFGDALDVMKLFTKKQDHIKLAMAKHGNYVIQCIIKRGEWYSELEQIKKFRNRFINDVFTERRIEALSVEKAGSHVIESCIRVGSRKQLNQMINAMKRNKASLLKMLFWDQFGNYVIGTLLEKCSRDQQEALVHVIHHHVADLTGNTMYSNGFDSYFRAKNVLDGMERAMDSRVRRGFDRISLCRDIKWAMDGMERDHSGCSRKRGNEKWTEGDFPELR